MITAKEVVASTLNDLDDRLPKGRSRCFDIGTWGGCGITCGAFLDGECEEPQEIPYEEILKEYGEEETLEIIELYPENTWVNQSPIEQEGK